MGHPIGGRHEIKTAYNRLWEAKTRGILIRPANDGYWLADVPLPEEASEAARIARKVRPKRPPTIFDGRPTGLPRGRARALNEAQVEAARRMLLSGKSFREVANYFVVTEGGLRLYFPRGGIKAFREQYASDVQPRRVVRKRIGTKRPGAGRKPTIPEETVDRMVEMRLGGAEVRAISEALGVSIFMVYRWLKRRGAVRRLA